MSVNVAEIASTSSNALLLTVSASLAIAASGNDAAALVAYAFNEGGMSIKNLPVEDRDPVTPSSSSNLRSSATMTSTMVPSETLITENR